MKIHVKRLDSGFYHFKGYGCCNWAQLPNLQYRTALELREWAFPQASEEFLLAVEEILKGEKGNIKLWEKERKCQNTK